MRETAGLVTARILRKLPLGTGFDWLVSRISCCGLYCYYYYYYYYYYY
jgi:hypothetical protein